MLHYVKNVGVVRYCCRSLYDCIRLKLEQGWDDIRMNRRSLYDCIRLKYDTLHGVIIGFGEAACVTA